MASSTPVWGIDLGQCALKALRCTLADDGKTMVADAFDYIEYPKMLTEPDANPEQLVRDALKQFLENHSVRDAKVAISVPGQSGLTRFIKLPPVEAKKIPDIVKYEAKQQIPFSLDDVIWDYQALQGGTQEDGVALETEVGLFAMKRDQVFRALRPFRDAGIELDVVQLTPIAIYNAVTHGVLEDLPSPSEYNPEEPPKSVAVVSMGTDTTDLVVTNGYKIWQRSIPIGGNHFTKQLTKEMKLTFASAEQLKRNARQAMEGKKSAGGDVPTVDDPKAIFTAMRPVFNDFVQDLQRSLGYFRSIDRRARIAEGVVLGNAMLLPGLQSFVEKNLELPMKKLLEFRNLTGPVVTAPKFKDNILSFAVSYGLCLQGLGKSRMGTNLVPREMLTARLIRRKKPWAVMAASLFLLGLGFNYLFAWGRWSKSLPDNFTSVASEVQRVQADSQKLVADDGTLKTQFDEAKVLGKGVVGGADARFLVLELFKAVNAAFPAALESEKPGASKVPFPKRPELYVESVDSEFFPSLADYVTEDVKARHAAFLKNLAFVKEQERRLASGQAPLAKPAGDGEAAEGEAAEGEAADSGATADAGGEAAAEGGAEAAAEGEAAGGEAAGGEDLAGVDFSKPGWVVQVKGFHFFNQDAVHRDDQYVLLTLLDKLENGTIDLPAGPGKPAVTFTMKEVGVFYPIIVAERRDVSVRVPDLNFDPTKQPAGAPARTEGGWNAGSEQELGVPLVPMTAYEFTVQFVWLETRASDRMEARRQKEQQQKQVDQSGDQVAGS
jgi:type IV pilus assembly protein PilM